jgi:competence protein ComEC
MPFWDRSIDLLIMTHPHQDHLAGLVEVLRRYRVSRVLYPDVDYLSPLFEEFRAAIAGKGVQSVAARAGQIIDLDDGIFMEVLHPPPEAFNGVASDIDNSSVVLRLEYGQVSFLLTGDIGREAEWELVRWRVHLESDVLKVAHHGSVTSTTPEFLAVVDPEEAVISVGADNDFGLPDEEVVGRLTESTGSENIYRTDIQGTIEFITDGEKLWVKTER